MLTFAIKKKRIPSIAPKRRAPTVSPMSHSLHLQQAKVRYILRSSTLQPKLILGQPNDKYEQEADRVADEVMRMPEPQVQRQVEPEEEEEETLQAKPLVSQITPLVQVQRQEEPEEEEETLQAKPLSDQIALLVQRQVEPKEEKEIIQPKEGVSQTPKVASDLESRIKSLRGGGQPLSCSVRGFFEPRFGYDFSQVRVHTDAPADKTARALNARAFTVGRDIVFGAGDYSPQTKVGRRLLSHELTHVVQQGVKGIEPTRMSQETSKNISPRIQMWKIKGNEATSDKDSDTLWDLSKRVSGSGMSWPCIKPVSMKSKKATGKYYFNYIIKGDKFDISNLLLKTGSSVNLRLVKPKSGYFEKSISIYYNGTYTSDPEADIEGKAEYGKKPIYDLVLSGHTAGTKVWGDGANWDVSTSNSEEPAPTKEQAERSMFPRRCWFTRNAQARIVGCCSEAVASPFTKAFLRKGAQSIGTTEGICGLEDYLEIPIPMGGSIKIPTSNYMTFDKLCAPLCPWPPPAAAKKCYSAACMNAQKDKWKIIKGKL